jgi:hypothetical protein
MSQHSSFEHNSEEEQKHQAEEQSRQGAENARVFDSAEELLRLDASQTNVPGSIAERLGKSLESLEKPVRPWWRRLLGS